jgi:hypothetical protein
MRAASSSCVPTAIPSRQTVRFRGSALAINLPDKQSSIRERLDAVFPAIPRRPDLIGAAYLEHDPDVIQVFRPKARRASTVVVPAMQLALSLSIGLAAFAAPDVIIPNQRSIVVETHVDLGALRARACLQHVVAEGDTLIAIARAHLGSAERWPEIVALNRSLDPERLALGSRFWLPPPAGTDGGDAAEAGEPLLMYRASAFPGWRGFVEPLTTTTTGGGAKLGGAGVLLVAPLARRVEVEAALGLEHGSWERAAHALEQGLVTRIDIAGTWPVLLAPDDVARRVDVLRVVERPEGGHSMALVSSVAYDESGAVIPAAESSEPAPVEQGEAVRETTDVPRSSSSRGSEFTMLLIAGSLGVGLVLLRSLRGTAGSEQR